MMLKEATHKEIHWKSWESLKIRKGKGGFGFWYITDFNDILVRNIFLNIRFDNLLLVLLLLLVNQKVIAHIPLGKKLEKR